MSNVFRRTSDFFKHHGQRHDSVDSTKSDPPDPNGPQMKPSEEEAPKTKSPEVEAPAEASPAKEQPKRRRWSLRHGEDEATRERRKSEQLEKDKEEFAATRKDADARRKSGGAGVETGAGWQG